MYKPVNVNGWKNYKIWSLDYSYFTCMCEALIAYDVPVIVNGSVLHKKWNRIKCFTTCIVIWYTCLCGSVFRIYLWMVKIESCMFVFLISWSCLLLISVCTWWNKLLTGTSCVIFRSLQHPWCNFQIHENINHMYIVFTSGFLKTLDYL